MIAAMITTLAAQAVPAVMPTTGRNADTKLVCHSEEITGTLAGRRRVCHTKAEWRQITDNAVATSQAIVDQNLTNSGNHTPGGG